MNNNIILFGLAAFALMGGETPQTTLSPPLSQTFLNKNFVSSNNQINKILNSGADIRTQYYGVDELGLYVNSLDVESGKATLPTPNAYYFENPSSGFNDLLKKLGLA